MAVVPTAEAEQAIRRANESVANYEDAVRASARVTAPRLRLGRDGSLSRLHAEDALLRLVAIAEHYAMSALIRDVEVRLPASDFGSGLWGLVPERSTESWSGRAEAWKKLIDVDVRGAGSDYNLLEGFIEARNAVAHGLGGLTRRQAARRAKVIAQLKAAGIPVVGDTVLVAEKNVRACASTVKAFILWLEHERASRLTNP